VHVIADQILALNAGAALVAVFLLPALEASAFVGFVFPGEIAVIIGGVLAFEHRFSLTAAIVAACAGAVLGDAVGYAVGHRYGERMLTKLPDRIVKAHHIDKAKDTLQRLGGKAVFVGRFTTALRVMIPGLAGMAKLPYRTFFFYNITGGVIWATGYVLVGYYAGSGWRHVEKRLSQGGLALLGLIVLVGATVVITRMIRRRRAARGAVDAESTPPTDRAAGR
jgi:membrane-associated protein